jgi:hypothetical protein
LTAGGKAATGESSCWAGCATGKAVEDYRSPRRYAKFAAPRCSAAKSIFIMILPIKDFAVRFPIKAKSLMAKSSGVFSDRWTEKLASRYLDFFELWYLNGLLT